MAIIGYIRVSSNKQMLEHQEFEIKKFAKAQNIRIDKWVKEKIKYPYHKSPVHLKYEEQPFTDLYKEWVGDKYH